MVRIFKFTFCGESIGFYCSVGAQRGGGGDISLLQFLPSLFYRVYDTFLKYNANIKTACKLILSMQGEKLPVKMIPVQEVMVVQQLPKPLQKNQNREKRKTSIGVTAKVTSTATVIGVQVA